MIAVLLIILKVILWIAAGVVALAVLILFVPISYRADQTGFAKGSGFSPLKEIAKDTALSARVTWLFGLLGIVVKKKKDEKDFRFYFRIAWIPIKINISRLTRKGKTENPKKPFSFKKPIPASDAAVYMIESAELPDKGQEGDKPIAKAETVLLKGSGHNKKRIRVWKLLEFIRVRMNKITDVLILFLKKFYLLVYTINHSCDKISDVSQILLYYVSLLKSDEFAAFIGIVKKELKLVLKRLFPSSLKIEMNVGNTDSYKLAQSQMLLAMLKPFLKKNLKLYVNSNDDYIGETIKLKGQFQVFTAAQVIIWYLRNKAYINAMTAKFKYSHE